MPETHWTPEAVVSVHSTAHRTGNEAAKNNSCLDIGTYRRKKLCTKLQSQSGSVSPAARDVVRLRRFYDDGKCGGRCKRCLDLDARFLDWLVYVLGCLFSEALVDIEQAKTLSTFIFGPEDSVSWWEYEDEAKTKEEIPPFFRRLLFE